MFKVFKAILYFIFRVFSDIIPDMDRSLEFSRRTLLKVAGVATLVITFLPKVAMASRNTLKSLRTGSQPGGKTRLVLETTSKPSYSLDYLSSPNRLVVNMLNTGGVGAKPSLASNTLIKSITQVQIGDKLQVVATLNKSIAPINKNQIMILEPNGGNGYRLVLDFSAGSGAVKVATTAAATESSVKKTPGKRVIVIDAGHGGKDPGCIGVTGVKEKNIVLSVARKLNNALVASGFSVYMTRKTDIFLNLGTRADIAQQKHADLFVSLHANANPSRATKGFSVYTLSKKASDIEAQKLADAENAADKIDVDGFERFEPDIRNALSALQQQSVAEMSVEFADGCVKCLRKIGAKEQDKPMRSAPFAVLKSTIPSALIELGHLSNRSEEALLNSSSHQDKLVSAISRAINEYDFE